MLTTLPVSHSSPEVKSHRIPTMDSSTLEAFFPSLFVPKRHSAHRGQSCRTRPLPKDGACTKASVLTSYFGNDVSTVIVRVRRYSSKTGAACMLSKLNRSY